MTITQVLCQYTQLHILNENMHIEILSVMHTYNIMISTTKVYSQLRTNIQHYYNKNYKTHIGTNLHGPITTKSYQISKDMDIETMPHVMYFTGNSDTVTKINQVVLHHIMVHPHITIYVQRAFLLQTAFSCFLCRMLLALFAGFLVPSCPKLALVFGECL